MSAPNTGQALATVLVDELARCGLTDACLAPGSRSAPLALAFESHPGVRVHVRIDERSAAFLALGLARGSRRPVAVVSTSGTAAVNLHPAVVEADAARVGLLALTADRPPELRGTGANQTIDQLGLYGSAVRWFADVGVAEARAGAASYWRSLSARAWAQARGAAGPAGPVHLNLAFREPLVGADGAGFDQPLEGRPDGAPWTACLPGPRPPSDADLAWLTQRVQASPRGLLVAGDLDTDPEPLLELAAVAAWPVLAEPQSGARAGEAAVSTYDLLLRDDAFAAAHRPDLVVTVGRVGLSKALLGRLAPDVTQVLVDRDGAWLDPPRAASRVVVADPSLVADAVAKAIRPREDSAWQRSWRHAEQRVRAAVDALLERDDAPSEVRAARDLAALLPDGSALVVASSLPVRHLNVAMRPRRGLRVLANRGASGIDGFVSTAVGVALAHDGPTFALAGDLSLLHDQNGLLAGPGEAPADLVVVVLNNDGGGVFSLLPQASLPAFERLFATPHGVDLAALAAATGCGHRRLERAGDLPAALGAARAARGIQVVEVRTERAATAALLGRLARAASRALG
ncbi:MAG TPA: 2-succinyl-5-enolpyruvyl-6-hydroxy-3-cyclohexene-1-carboxylic-acid synthase [Egibacteraceae bacterium]|nr:2-succinyl-5-enolpyruvyl-6-hydroxy-3-cyclohexene-1-carboxylic-acid synthase [Egibacteraceae bacterium]